MAQTKQVFADGAVIFREGESGKDRFELVSGSVDLLVKRDGKYRRERSIGAGNLLGTENDTKSGIRLFTVRASGRTVIRSVAQIPPSSPLPDINQEAAGMLDRLVQSFTGKSSAPKASPMYSNPGLLQRLMDGMATDIERIGIRVARLSGLEGEKHTRHIISAIGNTAELQTRSIEKELSIDPKEDIAQQLNRLTTASRRYLADQNVDLLIWGHVPETGSVMHLHFVSRLNWDQHAPGAFNLETTLALPTNFDGSMADLLRAVCLAAALPKTAEKKHLRASALLKAIGAAEAAFGNVPTGFSDREKACLYLCFGNAIAAAACPGYDPELLTQAQAQYQSARGNLSPDATPIDWAQTQKHIGCITHIEAERHQDSAMRNTAKAELQAALKCHDPERQGQAWAVIQHRLGLIYYRQGFDGGDTDLLRKALRCFQQALRIYTRADTPDRWAELMSHFAQTAQVLGGLQQSPDALATAVNACRSVLEIRDQKRSPKAWATSQNNLGSALFLLGKQTRSIERLEAAVDAFESALSIYEKMGTPHMALTTAKNLGRAKDMVAHYQPRNSTQQDWEDALAEGINPHSSGIDDELPWPGEGIQHQAV